MHSGASDIVPPSPLHPHVRDVVEGNAQRGGVAAVVDIAVVDDAAAVALAEGVERFIEAGLLFVLGGHDAGDGDPAPELRTLSDEGFAG